jgi:hypothetical protein
VYICNLRCSVCFNIQKNLADKAEYALYAEDETSAQQQSEGAAAAAADGSTQPLAQQAKKQRPIEVQVACMSRAGREPGYKKTNQDNCFAFEKYITEEQSMFGAMDGHGPHGKLPLLLTKLYSMFGCRPTAQQCPQGNNKGAVTEVAVCCEV